MKDWESKLSQSEWRYNRRANGKALTMSRVESLMKDLRSTDSTKRMIAANELGELKDNRASPLLIDALDDDSSYVRWVSIRSLGNIRCGEAVPLIVEALEDDDWSIRGTAARALGMIGDKRAVDGLIKISDDRDSDVRLEVISALAKIKDPKALPALIKALRDTRQGVREKAVDGVIEMATVSEIPIQEVQHSFMLFVKRLEEEGSKEEGEGKKEAMMAYDRIADAVKRSGHSGTLSKGRPKRPRTWERIKRLVRAVTV